MKPILSAIIAMNRVFKYIILGVFILFLLHSCVYHYMTHMNEEELEWITNRQEGELMYFMSAEGVKDTVIISQINIRNSLNPFNMTYFNTSNTEYLAGGSIHYRFNRTTGCEGSFYIQKQENNNSLYFYCGLLGRWSRNVTLQLTSMKINNDTLYDIMLFDERNTEQIGTYFKDNPIKSFAWSKKYGLVQYAFQDGTVFERIGI